MPEVIGFYRPYGPNGEFSNFYEAPFAINEIGYWHTEQYIMHQKAVLFGDSETAHLILKRRDPLDCKKLGRDVRNFSKPIWDKAVWGIALMGLTAKFSQNPTLKHKLLETRGNVLAECSPRDCIWGIGLGLEDPRHKDPTRWRGENLLGQCLMLVRDNFLVWQLDPEK